MPSPELASLTVEPPPPLDRREIDIEIAMAVLLKLGDDDFEMVVEDARAVRAGRPRLIAT
jgi:hypothetical protein